MYNSRILPLLLLDHFILYRNVVDLSMSAHKGGALTTTTNPAYEIRGTGEP